MPPNEEFADKILHSIEQEILRRFVLQRTPLKVIDAKSAEAQAQEILESLPPKDAERPDPYFCARDQARDIIVEWIYIADKRWGDQSEEL